MAQGSPTNWFRTITPRDNLALVTHVSWSGYSKITGATLLSRVNIEFLNKSCNMFSKNLLVATQVTSILSDTKLTKASPDQVRRFGYTFIRIESEFRIVIGYLTDLLLCSVPSRTEIWKRYVDFKTKAALVWKLFKVQGVTKGRQDHFPNRQRQNSNVSPNNSMTEVNILSYLEEARTPPIAEPRLVGAVLGFLAGALFTGIFGDNNGEQINKLNKNIQKNNRLIRVTNARIDMLAEKVAKSNQVIKEVLDKMVETNKYDEIYYAISWNMNQLISSTVDIKNTFKRGELTLTLLEKGILNADLIDIKSFQAIVSEGIESFPELEFPLEISRYTLVHITKIVKIHKIGHLNFLMSIPLSQKIKYNVTTLIPHPLQIVGTTLALPDIKDTILTDLDRSYIITNKENVYTISPNIHLLTTTEPIYRQTKSTCEWMTYQKNIDQMTKLCNFNIVGQINDSFVVETDKDRLVFFSKPTLVDLDCPNRKIREELVGLHKFPLTCDVNTNEVYYPSKQTTLVELINLNQTNEVSYDATQLPIINLNRSSSVHKNLKELIKKVTPENGSYTIDFDYYDLTLDQVQSYSIYSQTVLIIFVVINSVVIGFILFKMYRNKSEKNSWRKNSSGTSRTSYLRNKLAKTRDSLRLSLIHI